MSPDYIYSHICLAACYIATGNKNEAHKAIAKVLKIDPKFSLDTALIGSPFKDPSNTEKVLNLLVKAGLK